MTTPPLSTEQGAREMTLAEVVDTLPPNHSARADAARLAAAAEHWKQVHATLCRAVIGETGLSAIEVAPKLRERALAAESALAEAEARVDSVLTRHAEILEWLEEQIGTAWECSNCHHTTYHAFAKECAECGTDFPLEHLIAFKLGATDSEHPRATAAESALAEAEARVAKLVAAIDSLITFYTPSRDAEQPPYWVCELCDAQWETKRDEPGAHATWCITRAALADTEKAE